MHILGTPVQKKFAVQKIVRKHVSVGGAPEYRTLWEGHPEAEATWEPAESFAGCRELLAAFKPAWWWPRKLMMAPVGTENASHIYRVCMGYGTFVWTRRPPGA
jgi:hypothetical protein